jgi:nucleotide-binding universal stress UspA family protein
MPNLSRILIALDLSPMDERLMKALHNYIHFLGAQKAYFLHIMPNFNLPKEIDVEFHRLFSTDYPVDEKVQDKINLDLVEVFGENPAFETQVDVREGQPLQKLLHWIKVKEIDWLIVGNKRQSEGSGITARRVARQSSSNVFFVPNAPLRFSKKILIPLDFSENSARALRKAKQWQLIDPEVSIHGMYVIDLPPTDYYMRPVPTSGFQKVLRESAEQAYKKFLTKYELTDITIEMHYEENVYTNVATHIHEFIKKEEIDILMLGAQGHTAWNNFFFGSVTERLVVLCKEIPIIVVR